LPFTNLSLHSALPKTTFLVINHCFFFISMEGSEQQIGDGIFGAAFFCSACGGL
jgi:hypothetical protein